MSKIIYNDNILDVFQAIENLSDLINYIYNENEKKEEEKTQKKEGKRNNTEVLIPNINIKKNENTIDIKVELPGVSREEIELSIVNENNNNILKVTANRTIESINEKEKIIKKEIKEGMLKREIYLPDNIDNENITAEYKDGILNINIPIIKKSQEKKIKIS